MFAESNYDVGELQGVAQNVTKFILNNSVSKLPIKRSDIVANAMKGNGKVYQRAFDIAKNSLFEVYGIKILEVPEAKSNKQYITISDVSAASIFEYTPKQRGEITLLFIILSYIFMKGDPISEDGLFQILQKLRIPVDQSHPYFGSNSRKLITEVFVKQLYLKKEKVKLEATNEDSIMYSWGFRSTVEFPKVMVLNEVAKLLEKPTVCFVRQHREVHGDEGQEDVAMSQV